MTAPVPIQTTAQKGQPNGYASLDASGLVPTTQLPLTSFQATSQKGVANGYAGLGSTGVVPDAQLPPYYMDRLVAKGSAGTTLAIDDVTVGTVFSLTLSANLTLTFPTAAAGKSFTLAVTTAATAYTITWPATVKWPGGTAPTITATAAKTDLFTFMCIDGTNWLGAFIQNY
jgi:hypothetical protein